MSVYLQWTYIWSGKGNSKHWITEIKGYQFLGVDMNPESAQRGHQRRVAVSKVRGITWCH